MPTKQTPNAVAPGVAPPGLEPKAEHKQNAHHCSWWALPLLGSSRRPSPKQNAHHCSWWALPLLGSNQDSPDPESGVLPVTPRGSVWLPYPATATTLDHRRMELRGIEPLTS